MKTEYFEFSGSDQTGLPAVLWLPEGEVKLVLQITHGMTEHIGCYEAYAADLTAYGVAVAGFDLRGHGRNPGDPHVATFGDGGWEASIGDMKCFFDLLKARFPGTPHYMMGFSLGSFLLREYLGVYPEGIAGAIIMGTGHQSSLLLSVIMAIVKGQIKKAGFDNTTELIRQLSFGTYNQKFKPNRTSADWLCSDEARLDEYLADHLVRCDISGGLFWQLLASMKRTADVASYQNWNKDMPVLLLYGEFDPVGNNGKGVQAVYDRMKRAGMKHIEFQMLPDARHVLLQEESCGAAETTRHAIADWLLN